MSNERAFPVIFTPDNEPYLGLKSLFWFDRIIVWALSGNRQIASHTHAHKQDLTDLQRAACQIIPQGISVALSIRELLRQAYLFPALVLVRPLIERAAVMSYLESHPDAVALWHSGWKYRERPSLATMMHAMAKGEVDLKEARNLCQAHNHIVHGDPMGSYYNLVNLGDGRIGHAAGKVLDHHELCDAIAMESQCYLIILAARMGSVFPAIALPPMPDEAEGGAASS